MTRINIQASMSSFVLIAAAVFIAGCGSDPGQRHDFFTSGSHEADQRADQRMVKSEQLKGSNGAAPAVGEDTRPLYERLGGQKGVEAIVDDFTSRALVDPRVNWKREGVKRGGFSIHRGQSVTWDASEKNVELLKTHLAQFFALSTGGPPRYDGKEMKAVHAGMHISNAEFDAVVGDLKATLDKLKIANKEQKELLSVVESTRPEIVEER